MRRFLVITLRESGWQQLFQYVGADVSFFLVFLSSLTYALLFYTIFSCRRSLETHLNALRAMKAFPYDPGEATCVRDKASAENALVYFRPKTPLFSGDNSFEFNLQRWLRLLFGISSSECTVAIESTHCPKVGTCGLGLGRLQ